MWNISKTVIVERNGLYIVERSENYGILTFFLTTGPYAAGNFNVLFLPQVSSKLYDNIGYHDKSK